MYIMFGTLAASCPQYYHEDATISLEVRDERERNVDGGLDMFREREVSSGIATCYPVFTVQSQRVEKR